MFAQRVAGGSYEEERYIYTTSSVSSSVIKEYFVCVCLFTILNKAYNKGTRHHLDLDISMNGVKTKIGGLDQFPLIRE